MLGFGVVWLAAAWGEQGCRGCWLPVLLAWRWVCSGWRCGWLPVVVALGGFVCVGRGRGFGSCRVELPLVWCWALALAGRFVGGGCLVPRWGLCLPCGSCACSCLCAAAVVGCVCGLAWGRSLRGVLPRRWCERDTPRAVVAAFAVGCASRVANFLHRMLPPFLLSSAVCSSQNKYRMAILRQLAGWLCHLAICRAHLPLAVRWIISCATIPTFAMRVFLMACVCRGIKILSSFSGRPRAAAWMICFSRRLPVFGK